MSKHKDKPTQWYPILAELLRPLLHDYYEVQINVAVGDVPREADILLLRRTSDQPTPFRGLWRHLTTWNVLEFKGPSVSARLNDLNLLIELGLGIHRRLNEEQRRQKQSPLKPAEASFWYVVRSMGGRFHGGARQRLAHLEEIEPGLWRSQVLQHLVFLVDSETFASEPDSVPLHLLLKRPLEQERELAHLVIEQPHYLEWYGSLLSMYHSNVWQEVEAMARTKDNELKIDYDVMARNVDLEKFIAKIGGKRIIELYGLKKFIKEIGMDRLVSQLSPEELKELRERLK